MENPISLEFDITEMMTRKIAEAAFNSVITSTRTDGLSYPYLNEVVNCILQPYTRFFKQEWIDVAKKIIIFKYNTEKISAKIAYDTTDVYNTAKQILKSDNAINHVIYAWRLPEDTVNIHYGYFVFRNSIEYGEFCAHLYNVANVMLIKSADRIIELQ